MADVKIPSFGSFHAIMEEANQFASHDIHQAINLYHKLLEYFTSVASNESSPTSTSSFFPSLIQSTPSPPSFVPPPDKNTTSIDGISEEEVFRIQEQTLIALAQLYAKSSKPEAIRGLLREGRPLFQALPKARTAKIVRILLDCAALVPYSFSVQEELCKDCIDWCLQEKRTFLRLRVETRLAQLYYLQNKLQLGLQLIELLLKEVKKLDDKLLLVEIHLVESKLYFIINNIPRSKAALTAARTTANAINCPPSQQGDIDLQTGILHVQEKDPQTAFSYFLEAFDAFSSAATSPSFGGINYANQSLFTPPMNTPSSTPVPSDEAKSLQAFQYMLLTKIICGHPNDVFTLLTGKHGLKWTNYSQMEPFKEISRCYKERSLQKFETALNTYSKLLSEDNFANYHLHQLYDTFLEQNLQRVLEPYNKLELEYCAQLIDLPQARVEAKLSEMILDGKINGTLDQRGGQIILFEKHVLRSFYGDVLESIENMENVVDTLYAKAQVKK